MREMSIQQLRDFLDYDPVSGAFRWKPRGLPKWDAKWAGKTAGSPHSLGYWSLRINDRHWLAHRVAWAIVNGAWPSDQIDHIDGNRNNNAIANLRVVTNGENQQNIAGKSHNKSGHTGVSWFNPKRKWRSEIRADGKCYHLGYFDDVEEAAEAYRVAKRSKHKVAPELREVRHA